MATVRAMSSIFSMPLTLPCFRVNQSVRYLRIMKPKPGEGKPKKYSKKTKPTKTITKPAPTKDVKATSTFKSPKLTRPSKPTKPLKFTAPSKPHARPPPPSLSSLSALSYHPPPSNDPSQRALRSPTPSFPSLLSTTTLFTSQPPRFLYSAARFLQVPRNSHTPEVCLLGRSNVGKSTLINVLSGLEGANAGTAHGLRARGAGLAITSRKAGSTVCMNAYGFGVVSKSQTREYYEKIQAEREVEGGRSRGERRAKEIQEPPPSHRLVMVDMPGYGLGSEQEWGAEIAKYLGKRKALRGAVVLVDAVAGLKEMDRMVLEMLRDNEVRTTVVLTKADKVVGGGEVAAKGKVEEVCLRVWEELRRVEMGSLTWLEGKEKGWENEIWVTGAGDPGSGGLGVAGARWAICRMAGIVEDERVLKAPVLQKPVQKIVSFDQIKWAAVKADKVKNLRPSF